MANVAFRPTTHSSISNPPIASFDPLRIQNGLIKFSTRFDEKKGLLKYCSKKDLKIHFLQSSLISRGFNLYNGSKVINPFHLKEMPFHKRHKHSTLVRAESETISSVFLALPGAGPVRDAIFASIGAASTLLIASIAAWFWQREDRRVKEAAAERGEAAMPEVQTEAGQKESVEWVNMVLHKIWKVYRRSLEAWLVGLLQPAIDKLPKPDYVTRVEIAEFSLDMEPLSVRNVQRRASRRVNDLQYHVGLRYSGGARCLLVLHLSKAGVITKIPVGVHDLDVDAEMWVKLGLAPISPYVGTLSIAFVRLPTIKLVLAPFRMLNLFSIPFLSRFLSKLLTVDLPRLLVLPRHITFDFLPHNEEQRMASSVFLDLLKSETFTGLTEHADPGDTFVGELTVTLCEARNLPSWYFSGWSDPYCDLVIGDQRAESKRNSETSHPAGPRDPVWNQDFLFWVEDPVGQKLVLNIRDSVMTLKPSIGFVEFPVWQLKDCVPVSMWLPLQQESPLGVKSSQGEIRLLLTYKSYVDEYNYNPDIAPYIKVFSDSDSDSDRDLRTGSVEGSNSSTSSPHADVSTDPSNADSSEKESSGSGVKELAWGAAMWTIAEISKWLDNVSRIKEEEEKKKRDAQEMEREREKSKREEVALVLYSKDKEKEGLVSVTKIEELMEEERRQKFASSLEEAMAAEPALLPEGDTIKRGFRHGVASAVSWTVNHTVDWSVSAWRFIVSIKGEDKEKKENEEKEEREKESLQGSRKDRDGVVDGGNEDGGMKVYDFDSETLKTKENEHDHTLKHEIRSKKNIIVNGGMDSSSPSPSSPSSPLSSTDMSKFEKTINGVSSNYSSSSLHSISSSSSPSPSSIFSSPPFHYQGDDFMKSPDLNDLNKEEVRKEGEEGKERKKAMEDFDAIRERGDEYFNSSNFTNEEIMQIKRFFNSRP